MAYPREDSWLEYEREKQERNREIQEYPMGRMYPIQSGGRFQSTIHGRYKQSLNPVLVVSSFFFFLFRDPYRRANKYPRDPANIQGNSNPRVE